MMNHRLLGMFAVMTLLLPINIQNLLVEDQTGIQTNTQTNADDKNAPHASNFLGNLLLPLLENEKVSEDKPVTASVSSQTASEPEDNRTSEEELKETMKEWKNNLPFIEEDSPQAKFINAILPAAILIANEHDIYPSVMIAQAALESSWGQSDLAQQHNNLMGTKGSWNGESVKARTREDVNGESVYIDAGFSVYDSWADSLHRYGLLMKNGIKSNPAIYEGTWRENTEAYTDATAWLQGRYATDTAYANKLNQTIQSFNLNQYDNIDSPAKDLEKILAQLTIENETNL